MKIFKITSLLIMFLTSFAAYSQKMPGMGLIPEKPSAEELAATNAKMDAAVRAGIIAGSIKKNASLGALDAMNIFDAMTDLQKADATYWFGKELNDSTLKDKAEEIRKRDADAVIKNYGTKALPYIFKTYFEQKARVISEPVLRSQNVSEEDISSVTSAANNYMRPMAYLLHAYGKDATDVIDGIRSKIDLKSDQGKIIDELLRSTTHDIESVEKDTHASLNFHSYPNGSGVAFAPVHGTETAPNNGTVICLYGDKC